jgi:hypothetical protein
MVECYKSLLLMLPKGQGFPNRIVCYHAFSLVVSLSSVDFDDHPSSDLVLICTALITGEIATSET